MEDEEVYVEPVSLPLTRPPMKWGVRYEVFALNGMAAVIGFIATSSFTLGLGLFSATHLISAYLCQRDPYIFHIFERRLSKRGAVANSGFWGARSYSP
jgi:type IV secretion system protein VirB3